ncbi:MAG: glutamate 5-kinase [Candidatus Omnitrophica bacterium]|nr:glutamate 5-kinase [Candidatus Omnitrophota bacterium]
MKRIVIKVGTGVLTDKGGVLDDGVVRDLVRQIAVLLDGGREVLLVSSGAIGSGLGLVGMKRKPNGLSDLQALAAIGQAHLMETYNKFLSAKGYRAGQILVTQADFDDRKRYLNIRYTIDALIAHKAVPIINENDTVSTEEIKCGDNDRISSLVADLVSADGLIILSTVDGLLDASGSVVKTVHAISADIHSLVLRSRSELGSGGMATKLAACEFAVKSGIECFIGNGKREDMVINIIKGQGVYTHFKSHAVRYNAKKRWIGFGSKPKGTLVVDAGARLALAERHKSLLPAGIVSVKGTFGAGDSVTIADTHNREIARGITNYSSQELEKIKGKKTKDIGNILGYKDYDEVIHIDNMILL